MKINPFHSLPSLRAGQLPLGQQSFLDYRSGQTVLHVGAADRIRLSPAGSAVQMTVNDGQQLRLGPGEWPHMLLEGHRANVSIAPELAPLLGGPAAGEMPAAGPAPAGSGAAAATLPGTPAGEPGPAWPSGALREGGKSLRHMLLEQQPPSPSFRRMEDLVAPLARQLDLGNVPLPRHAAGLAEFMPLLESRLAGTPAAVRGVMLGELVSGSEAGPGGRRLMGPEQRELAGRVMLSARSTADFRSMLDAVPDRSGLIQALGGDETFALLCGAAGLSVTPGGIGDLGVPGFAGGEAESAGSAAGRLGARAGLDVRQMSTARQELSAWPTGGRPVGDARRLLESPAALVMATPAEKGALLRSLADGFATPGDEWAMAGALASAPDPAAFTAMLRAGGWDDAAPVFRDPGAGELFQQLAGAFGRAELATDGPRAASVKDMLTAGLAGTGGLPESPGGDPFLAGGLKLSPAALAQDPRLIGEGLGRQLSRAIGLQDPRSLNLTALAGGQALTGGEMALPEWRSTLLRGLGETAMPAGLRPLLERLGTALPPELQLAPMGRPSLPTEFRSALADPEQALSVLHGFLSEQGRIAGLGDLGLRQAVVQPLLDAVRNVQQDVQALAQQFRRLGTMPAAATGLTDLGPLTQATTLLAKGLSAIGDGLESLFPPPPSPTVEVLEQGWRTLSGLLPWLTGLVPELHQAGRELALDVAAVLTGLRGGVADADRIPALAEPVPDAMDKLSALTRQGATFIRAWQDGSLLDGVRHLSEVARQSADPVALPVLPDLARHTEDFRQRLVSGQWPRQLEGLQAALQDDSRPLAVEVRQLVRHGLEFQALLTGPRLAESLPPLEREITRLDSHPALPRVMEPLSHLRQAVQALRQGPEAADARSAETFSAGLQRFAQTLAAPDFAAGVTGLTQSAGNVLRRPILQESLDMLHPAGVFMAYLRSGDFVRLLTHLKETSGDKTVLQQAIEESIPSSTQSGSFLRVLTSDTLYHVVEQLVRRHEQPARANIPFDRRVMEELGVVGDSSRFLRGLMDGTSLAAITQFGHQLNVAVNLGDVHDLLPRFTPGRTPGWSPGEMDRSLRQEYGDLRSALESGHLRLPDPRDILPGQPARESWTDTLTTRTIRA